MPGTIVDFGDTSSSFSVYSANSDYLTQVYDGSAFHDLGGSHLTWQASSKSIISVRSGTDNLAIARDGVSGTTAALAAGAITGAGKLYGTTNRGVYDHNRADFFSIILAPNKISNADNTALMTALRSIHGTVAVVPALNAFLHGDSITDGIGADNNLTLPRQLADAYGATVQVFGYGHSGDMMQYSTAGWWFQYAPPYRYIQSGATNVLIVWLGTNDIALGRTLAQLQADWISYVNGNGNGGPRTSGWNKIVAVTALPRGDIDSGKDAIRLSFNSWLKGAALTSGLIDAVFDVDALTATGGVLANYVTDATLSPDHLHPTENAYGLMKAPLKAVVDTII